MILLTAILLGLISGMVRAELEKHPYRTLKLKKPGLVVIAFLAQFGVFQLSRFGFIVEDNWVAVTLVVGQVILLVFSFLNRKSPGFIFLALGTLLNLAVMLLNGGLMPMSPETITNLNPQASPNSWSIGERLGNSKNIALGEEMTRLSFLSDRYILPDWLPYRVAFSLGDVVLSVGAFWFFWSLGRVPHKHEENTNGKKVANHSPLRAYWRGSHRKGMQPDPDRGCD
jgi:hypothetical protein